jgi:hypothetical protein
VMVTLDKVRIEISACNKTCRHVVVEFVLWRGSEGDSDFGQGQGVDQCVQQDMGWWSSSWEKGQRVMVTLDMDRVEISVCNKTWVGRVYLRECS